MKSVLVCKIDPRMEGPKGPYQDTVVAAGPFNGLQGVR